MAKALSDEATSNTLGLACDELGSAEVCVCVVGIQRNGPLQSVRSEELVF